MTTCLVVPPITSPSFSLFVSSLTPSLLPSPQCWMHFVQYPGIWMNVWKYFWRGRYLIVLKKPAPLCYISRESKNKRDNTHSSSYTNHVCLAVPGVTNDYYDIVPSWVISHCKQIPDYSWKVLSKRYELKKTFVNQLSWERWEKIVKFIVKTYFK